MKALVVLVTVWKARMNVGKEGKRIWSGFMMGMRQSVCGKDYSVAGFDMMLRGGWRRASAPPKL
jgi:hypothetical protein